jgi:hypothetical protein
MKQVQAKAILANPQRIDRQHACPDCSARTVVFEDGSLVCVAESKCFEPEPKDSDLWSLRQEFDRRNGIDAARRSASSDSK